jgi:hypothetical protein
VYDGFEIRDLPSCRASGECALPRYGEGGGGDSHGESAYRPDAAAKQTREHSADDITRSGASYDGYRGGRDRVDVLVVEEDGSVGRA